MMRRYSTISACVLIALSLIQARNASAQWASTAAASRVDFFNGYTRHVVLTFGSLSAVQDAVPATARGAALYGRFLDNEDDSLRAQWEVPSDWNQGNVYIEIDWFPETTIPAGETVEWVLCIQAVGEGTDAISDAPACQDIRFVQGVNGNGTAWIPKHSISTAFTTTHFSRDPHDHVFISVTRDGDDATHDTFAGVVGVSAIEIIYTSTGLPRN